MTEESGRQENIDSAGERSRRVVNLLRAFCVLSISRQKEELTSVFAGEIKEKDPVCEECRLRTGERAAICPQRDRDIR